jgi:hypothetical protein
MARRRQYLSGLEELLIYLALVIVGAIPIGVALVNRTGFGGEATIGLLMLLAGISGLTFRAWSHRHRAT